MGSVLLPLRRLHGNLHEAKMNRIKAKSFQNQVRGDRRKVFLVLTPEHGNLGDQAIAAAEIELLKSVGIECIEITDRRITEMMNDGELGLFNGLPVLVHGGGNLGTLWMNVENKERALLKSNPRSRIVNLPNTIYYEDSNWGREEFEKSKNIYNAHKHLYLYAREKSSFEVMSKAYRNVKLVPDMVLYLNRCKNDPERHGCILCLRSDKEKTRTEEQEAEIIRQARSMFGDDIIMTDMVEPHPIHVSERETALENKFSQFSGAELVITDRLHGMIFCAITGTPCVVIDSKSPKVRGCYEWIKQLDYIRFADDVSQIAETYRRIPAGEHHYDNSHLLHYYEELANDVKRIMKGKKPKCR